MKTGTVIKVRQNPADFLETGNFCRDRVEEFTSEGNPFKQQGSRGEGTDSSIKIFHARLHPVPSSPRLSRLFLAASI